MLFRVRRLGMILLVAWLTSIGATSNDAPKVGDRAPDFTLADQNGKTVRLSEFLGKKRVVLAFYTKAFTPG
jgi:peroxiredoxin